MARLGSLFRRGNAFALLYPSKGIVKAYPSRNDTIKMPPSDLNHPRRHE